jgi:hypothetical protein
MITLGSGKQLRANSKEDINSLTIQIKNIPIISLDKIHDNELVKYLGKQVSSFEGKLDYI